MSHKIVRNIRRPIPKSCVPLGELGVATVHEAQGRTGLMKPYMRPIYPGARAAGSAMTISSQPGDNLMIHAAMDVCQPGDILVVTTTSESTRWNVRRSAGRFLPGPSRGGLIIDAGVRDTAELTAMDFPVWAKAVHAQGTVKSTAGSVNVPVVCAGAVVHPGDVIVADADGVVVVPRGCAAAVAKAGQERVAKEEKTRERLRNGELGLDFYGLRDKLKQLGVEYVNEE